MNTILTRNSVLSVLVLSLVVFGLFLEARAGATKWQEKVDPTLLTTARTAGEVDFFVIMQDQADVSGARALQTKAEKGIYVYERLTSLAKTTQAPLRRQLKSFGAFHKSFWISNLMHVRGDLDVIQAMAERAEVSRIEPMAYGRVPKPVVEPADLLPESRGGPTVENHLVHVNADDVWALGITGQGAVVGGSDTGVAWTHNALKNQYRGWNAIDQVATHDYNWFAGAAATQCLDDSVPCASGTHGTHTMGTMVGDDGVSNKVGMAPGAQWIACRNHLQGTVATVSTYLACMEFMLAPSATDGSNPDPTLAPDAVNNSWSCAEQCGHLLVAPLENSVAAGIFYAASAGNDGPECSTDIFPLSNHEAAVSVASTIHIGPNADKISSFSSRGPVLTDLDQNGVPKAPRTSPDIAAPGSTLRSSTTAPNNYGNSSGTSMATPMVTGLAALLVSANEDLRGKPELIFEIMKDTAVPLYPEPSDYCGDDIAGARPNNTFGWGRIDALAAVQMATADADGDGKADLFDNCTDVANPSQCNSNAGSGPGQDIYGNHCDADLDDNGIVNTFDLTIMRDRFGNAAPAPYDIADLDCNGIVNSFDLAIMRAAFGNAPGPGNNN